MTSPPAIRSPGEPLQVGNAGFHDPLERLAIDPALCKRV